MKVKVIRRFKDLKAGKLREVGEEFDANSERLSVLLGDNPFKQVYVEQLETFDDLTVKELKEVLDQRGVEYSTTAKKADLVALVKE